MTRRYPQILFEQIAEREGVDLLAAFGGLERIYQDVERRNAANTQALDLPCRRGCDMCCQESVFLTPLEFFYVWHHAQKNLEPEALDTIIEQGLFLYQTHRLVIDALNRPPPDGAADHFSLVRNLKFRCPLLSEQGVCQVYPARELAARIFGCSFNDAGGIYGCHLVSAHLADKEVTLLPARPTLRRLNDLPLTHYRQVYPYYIHLLFGGDAPS